MGRKHAKLNASGASRWTVCTNAPDLEAKFPESSSVYADEGTLAHELGELLLKVALGYVSKKKAKYDLEQIKAHALYKPEMLDHCEGFRDFIMEQYSEALMEDPNTSIFLEEQFDYSKYVPEGFGTSDNVIVNSVKLRVNDLKYGMRPVEAEGNKQLRIYGLGVHEKFRKMYEYEDVQLAIYQPRLPGPPKKENISVFELTKWGHTYLKPIAKVAWSGKGEFVPGEHCFFCRAKARCRALADYNLELLKYDFGLGAILNHDEIPEILVKGALLVDWFSSFEKAARHEALENGVEYEGFKIVEGRSNRTYANKEKVIKYLEDRGFTKNEIMKRDLLGLENMIKAIGLKEFERMEKKGLVHKPKGAPTLVPVTDKRPKYNNALDDFKDLT